MASWIDEVQNNVWIVLAAPLLLGLLVPQLAFFYDYAKPLIMLIVFVTALKIGFGEFKSSLASLKAITAFYAALFVAFPAIAFLAAKNFLPPDFAIALLTALLMPAGVATPTYSDLLKGKTALSLAIVFCTMVVVPFVVPFELFFLTGKIAGDALAPMFLLLAQILLIPFAAALAVKKLAPRSVEKTRKYFSSVSLLAITVVIASSIAIIPDAASKALAAAPFLAAALAFLLALAAIGYFAFAGKSKRGERTSFGLAAFYRNYVAAIVFAGQFLSADALLFVVLMNIPLDVVVTIYAFLLKKTGKN